MNYVSYHSSQHVDFFIEKTKRKLLENWNVPLRLAGGSDNSMTMSCFRCTPKNTRAYSELDIARTKSLCFYLNLSLRYPGVDEQQVKIILLRCNIFYFLCLLLVLLFLNFVLYLREVLHKV